LLIPGEAHFAVIHIVEQGQVDLFGAHYTGFFPGLVQDVVVNELLQDASVGEALDDFLFYDFFLVIGGPLHGGQYKEVKEGIQALDTIIAQGIVGHQGEH